MKKKHKIVILGAGGLAKSALKILKFKKELSVIGVCSSKEILFKEKGLNLNSLPENLLQGAQKVKEPIGEFLKLKDKFDGVFVALPNLPNTFIPQVVKRFIKANYQGVMVDVLKRTSAVKQLLRLKKEIETAGLVYITGAGATPGLLTAAAALGAQSFIKLEKIEIYFGVGISNWEQYKATIREDIAHLKGYNVEKAQKMSEREINQLLARRKGILKLENMEHADDIILAQAGIIEEQNVKVGGVVDTRSAKKPVTTTLKISGITFEGKKATHTFTLGDDTSMAANVIGTALGYLKTGFWLKERGITGLFTPAELMPRFVK